VVVAVDSVDTDVLEELLDSLVEVAVDVDVPLDTELDTVVADEVVVLDSLVTEDVDDAVDAVDPELGDELVDDDVLPLESELALVEVLLLPEVALDSVVAVLVDVLSEVGDVAVD